ncbi:MAG: translocation/assembly module TamB domain-containing protein [Flavobacteriaceae bacterium]|nr:translocation/assembly module TamB domain-containing protein [Flavobacteriaceae bacterium]
MHLLNTGSIQEKVIQSLTNKISEKYSVNISVNSSELSIEGGIILNDVLLNDHYNDTLIYINNLKTNLKSLDKILDGNVRFTNLQLKGLILNIKKYSNDQINSLQFFLNLVKSKRDTTKFLPIISTSFLKIQNSEIRLPNISESYKIFNLKSNNFIAGPDFVETSLIDGNFEAFRIKNFSFKSDSFKYSGCSVLIDDYILTSDQGKISGNLKYESLAGNVFDYFEKPKIYSNLTISNFKPAKIGMSKKIDPLLTVSANLDVVGTLDSINIKNGKFDFGFLKFEAELKLLNIFSEKENMFSGYVKTTNVVLSELKNNIKIPVSPIVDFKKHRIKKFYVTGNYSSNKWNINADIETDFGDFKTKLLNSKIDKLISNSILVDVKNLNLSKLYNSFPEGFISSNINIKLKNDLFDWKIREGYFTTSNFAPIQFSLNGLGNFKKGNLSLSSSNGLEVPFSQFEYDFSSKVKKLSSVINLESYNLSSINNKIGGGKAILSGVFKSKIEGESIDKSSIILTVQNLQLQHKNGLLNSSDLYLNSFNKNGVRNFSIINSSWLSGEAIGRFDLSKTKILINNALSETFPIIPKLNLSKPQEMKFDFTLSKELVNILNTDIESTENFNLVGYLNSDEYKSYLDIEVPFFQYQDFFGQGLKANINNKSSNRGSEFVINKFIYKNSNFGEFLLGSKRKKNKLSINVQLKPLLEKGNGFNLSFDVSRLGNNMNVLNLTDSSIIYNNGNWNLKELENEPIIYDYKNNSIEFNNFKLTSENSEIKVKGFYKGLRNFDIDLSFHKVNLNHLVKHNENFTTEGLFNSSWRIKRTSMDNSMKGFLSSSEVYINNVFIGEIDLNINGNTELNSYAIDWNLVNNNINTFSGTGNFILDNNSSKLDLDILFSKFDISFSSPLAKSMSNIRGYLDGGLNIWGDFSNLQNSGLISLTDSGFSIPYLNIDYSLTSTTELNFYNNILEILPTELSDNIFDTKANFKAKFSHLNFKDWNMDLLLDSNGLLLLNKKETPDVLFYGEGFLSGDISMKGPTKNPQLELVGLTAPGTSIKIPWKDTQEISDISFITFVDKKSKSKSTKLKKLEPLNNEVRGLEMFFELDINPDAAVKIVIDQSSGSYLSGRGVGKLLMETNTKGKFNMWGDFSTSDGIYNFKNLGLLDKKFNLEPGGTIVWDGNPLGAQMNLNALYQVPGGANPAILLDNPNFNKKIPTEVGIHLQGNLLKPDNPIFEIFFPNTSGTVVSEINYRLADPQRSQLQAISLLSQGVFINDVSVSVQGITNNLYEKASDIFTSIIGDNDEKLKVGINYLQGDRNPDLDIFSEDRLGLTLSTQVSDKILINGKIGVPVGGVNETLIVGDVQIDFILNEDGSLKAKVFNRENEFRYIGDKLGYTQGMGISYNVDFNNFKELINKIIKEAQ